MKKIKKLTLTQLNKSELGKRELNKVAGGADGDCCICAHGPENHRANEKGGLYSPSLMGIYTSAW